MLHRLMSRVSKSSSPEFRRVQALSLAGHTNFGHTSPFFTLRSQPCKLNSL